ncbi:unnamed protein product, partial [Sphacelaria rigidula]
MIEIREEGGLRRKVEEEEHLKIHGGLGEGTRIKTYLHGPAIDAAKNIKLRFRVGDLDLPERRNKYASSREEEEDAQNCPCGKAIEIRSRIVAECELYKAKRDVIEGEM